MQYNNKFILPSSSTMITVVWFLPTMTVTPPVSVKVSMKLSEFSNTVSCTAATFQQTWVVVLVNVSVLVGSTVRSIIWPGKQ